LASLAIFLERHLIKCLGLKFHDTLAAPLEPAGHGEVGRLFARPLEGAEISLTRAGS